MVTSPRNFGDFTEYVWDIWMKTIENYEMEDWTWDLGTTVHFQIMGISWSWVFSVTLVGDILGMRGFNGMLMGYKNSWDSWGFNNWTLNMGYSGDLMEYSWGYSIYICIHNGIHNHIYPVCVCENGALNLNRWQCLLVQPIFRRSHLLWPH